MSFSSGIRPFWFWNGDMDDQEIAEQIRKMSKQGIKGFFIHPRQGLKVPYLSNEWFHKVGVAVDSAKKYGLEVWLYDEYPYPSGVSGGEVILGHPEFEAKMLRCNRADVEGPSVFESDLPWGQVVMAKAYPIVNDNVDWDNPVDISEYIGIGYLENIFQMSGLTQYNRKRFFTGVSARKVVWQVPKGKWHVCIILQVTVEHFKYFEKFVDPLNPKAVAYFIQTTHEKYREHFGNEFGKTIKGIFTDEITAFPNSLPWSTVLPELFEKRNGYSLIDKLPALFERMGKDTDKTRYDYWNTVTEAFIDSYEVQVRDWCSANNLMYVGEKPIIRTKQLQYFHIPGIDAGHQKVGSKANIVPPEYRANGKMVSSAAHFYNKPAALCECFHSIGWGMTLQDMKWTFDWLMLQGVNYFVPHAFFYTTDALTKHDAPPSSFYQMPYWSSMNLLSEYAGKVADIMANSSRKIDILVLDPVSSQWTAMGEKHHLREKIKKDFSQLQRTLLENHFDYYIIDPELLAEADVTGGCIKINGESYELLVLPPLLNIEDKPYVKLKEYIKGGGKVVACGCLPVERIGCMDDQAQFWNELLGETDVRNIYESYIKDEKTTECCDICNVIEAGKCMQENSGFIFVRNISSLPVAVERVVERDISVTADGKEEENILAACYCHGEKKYYFLVNLSGKEIKANVRVSIADTQKNLSHELRSLDIGYGEDYIAYKQDENGLSFEMNFAPYQSYLLEDNVNQASANVQPAGDNKHTEASTAKINLDISGLWEVTSDHMNALRLGDWKLEIEGVPGKWSVDCCPIIDQVADGGIPIPIKLKKYFGCPKEIEFPPLKCKYSINFALEGLDEIKPILLVIEPESVMGDWHILVNGHPVYPADFTRTHVYLPSNLAVDISAYVKAGLNEINVVVNTSEKHDGLVNPLYVFGRFEVYRNDDVWMLTSPRKEGTVEDLTAAGYPFFAGTVKYKRSMELSLDENSGSDLKTVEIRISEPYLQDTVSLYINGHYAGTRAWSPYTWKVPAEWLNGKDNVVELHIATTLQRLFEGEYFDHLQHRYVKV